MLKRLFSSGHSNGKTEQALQQSKKSWFHKLGRLFNKPQIDDKIWEEIEELLISADLGVQLTMDLINQISQKVRTEHQNSSEAALKLLKGALLEILLSSTKSDGFSTTKITGPIVILVVGVNGTGKTTSIAKLANIFRLEGQTVMFAAADTFRAAAIDQIQYWANLLNVDVIAHRPGADPGAVVYDALESARARKTNILIVDTAGRLHTQKNLMDELQKVTRVIKRLDEAAPHQTLLVIDATTGQNGLTQARNFVEAVACDGIILAKLDGTAKGGIVFAISKELGLPINFVGTGESLEDLAPFDPEAFVDALFSEEFLETSQGT